MALAEIDYLGALARLLPERDPHEAVYEALTLIADRLDDAAIAPALVAHLEAQVLAECGSRLDLPLRRDRSDRGPRLRVAALGPGGEPRAPARRGATASCRFPAFLREGAGLEGAGEREEVADGFRMTGFFLQRDVFAIRGEPLPNSRRAFLAAAAKAGESGRR